MRNQPIVTKHAIETLKKYDGRQRSRQRNKRLSKEAYRNGFKKWHALTRERLLRTGFNDSYDEKWGRFKPDQRFNIDQTPMPLAVNTKRTYEEIQPNRQEKVWIAQLGSGLDKRQCTIQMMTRAEGEQPRIAISFAVLGKLSERMEEQLGILKWMYIGNPMPGLIPTFH